MKCTYIYFVVFSIMFILLFIFSFVKMFAPIIDSNKYYYLGLIFVLILFIIGCYSFIGILNSSTSLYNKDYQTEYRIAGLLIAAFIICKKLLEEDMPNPLLHTLILIRRNLLLNRTTTETAIEQIDTTLLGLKVSDILQKDLAIMLDMLSELNAIKNEYQLKSNALKNIIEKDQIIDTPENQTIIEALRNDILGCDKSILRIQNNLNKRIDNFVYQCKKIKRISPEAMENLLTIISKFEIPFKAYIQSWRTTCDELSIIIEKLPDQYKKIFRN